MSFLRQRAIEASLEATFRALKAAAARAWFVRLTSWASDEELNEFASQAKVACGAASSPTDVRANASIVMTARQRGCAASAVRERVGASGRSAGTKFIDSVGPMRVTGWGVRWDPT